MRPSLPARRGIGAPQRVQCPLISARINLRSLHSYLLTCRALHRCVPRHVAGTQHDAAAPSLSSAAGPDPLCRPSHCYDGSRQRHLRRLVPFQRSTCVPEGKHSEARPGGARCRPAIHSCVFARASKPARACGRRGFLLLYPPGNQATGLYSPCNI